MDHNEQRDTAQGQREEDARRFEQGREVHEERTRNTSEEASEEDCRQWEKTHDISKEVAAIPEEAHEPDRRPQQDREQGA